MELFRGDFLLRELFTHISVVLLGGAGNIKTLSDSYQFTVDVRDFSPEDVIVTTSNSQIEVHAEKVSNPTPHPSSKMQLPLVEVLQMLSGVSIIFTYVSLTNSWPRMVPS